MRNADAVGSPLAEAHAILKKVIRERGLRVGLNLTEGWVEILLLSENRSLWLGHERGAGFFVTWDRDLAPAAFFHLEGGGFEKLLSMLPPPRSGDQLGEVLLESLASSMPDVELLQEVIDTAPATPEGLNALAMLFSLRSCRLVVDRLRELLATQNKDRHQESVYQKLLTDAPWMLGSQYTKVIRTECTIWFGSRVDLFLASVLGYIDVVEVKRPDVDLLVKDGSHGTWHQGQELSRAISQARKYRRVLEERRFDIAREIGLSELSASQMFRSSIIVVIGRNPVEPKAIEALKDINSDHRNILILTYDDVLAIAEATIGLLEKGLHSHQALPA